MLNLLEFPILLHNNGDGSILLLNYRSLEKIPLSSEEFCSTYHVNRNLQYAAISIALWQKIRKFNFKNGQQSVNAQKFHSNAIKCRLECSDRSNNEKRFIQMLTRSNSPLTANAHTNTHRKCLICAMIQLIKIIMFMQMCLLQRKWHQKYIN